MNKYIAEYHEAIRTGHVKACPEQLMLIDLVEDVLNTEAGVYVDDELAERYFKLARFLPFKLLSWECYVFVLHNCTFDGNGELRFPELLIFVGRGTGKNGYLTFEDLACSSPVNGIKKYNCDTFATSYENAKTSFMQLHDMIEGNAKLQKAFDFNLKRIVNKKTQSEIACHTANAKTKDGMRPGKVNIDEIHTYENWDLINVALTGRGKVEKPRLTITTTDGYVRNGPLDFYLEKSLRILRREEPDNGFLPFICRCSDEEVTNPDMWVKAIPSINDFPTLKRQMLAELEDYKRDPVTFSSFALKRLNCRPPKTEDAITSVANIRRACDGVLPSESGIMNEKIAAFGIDFTLKNDFATAVIGVKVGAKIYVDQHTWICKASEDLPLLSRESVPIEKWVERGEAEYVDDVEIPAEIIVQWLITKSQKIDLIAGAVDNYRWADMKKAFSDLMGYKGERRGKSNDWGRKTGIVYRNRPSDTNEIAGRLITDLERGNIIFGDSMIMRYFLSNVRKYVDPHGFVALGKFSNFRVRKTDGVSAVQALYTVLDLIDGIYTEEEGAASEDSTTQENDVYIPSGRAY